MEIIDQLVEWVKGALSEIVFAWVATMLVIYGSEISKLVKGLIRGRHFVLRISVFVFISAFGYGWLTARLTRLLVGELSQRGDLFLLCFVVLAFLVLGILADRKRQL